MSTDQTIVNEWKSDGNDDSDKGDGPLTFGTLRQQFHSILKNDG